MRRARPALAGAVLVALSCVIGCCLPAFTEPLPPGNEDFFAQQAAWDHMLGWFLGIAALLLLGGYLLLAHGWLSWRIERRKAGPRWPPRAIRPAKTDRIPPSHTG